MINSYLAHSSDLHSTLREKGILFVEDDNLVYLIDKKNKVIVSTDDLGINIIKDGYSKDRITLVTLDKMERINVEQDSELARGFNLIDAICDILSQHINVQQDKSPNRKKKRGQQQKLINISKDMIILFGNQKGGCGKTTNCIQFANYLSRKRKRSSSIGFRFSAFIIG